MIVSTFNLKNSFFPSITPNKWVKRMDASAAIILGRDLDVVGFQELTPRAKEYLEKILSDYLFIGNSRGSMGVSDEYNCILLKRELFTVLGSETYSLSNNMYNKGGKFLLDAFPRICTVAHVIKENQKYLILNTHLDNVFERNRKLQLKVIEKVIRLEKRSNESIIVMGDFNMTINGPLAGFCESNQLVDAVMSNVGSSYRSLNKKPIDHILISDSLKYEDTQLIKDKYDGVYPSDHFPIQTKVLARK